jgi:bis(5'-adenosyl)-triphosphatase
LSDLTIFPLSDFFFLAYDKDVLVIPTRSAAKRLADLTPPELGALMSSVQHVGSIIERAYGANALTVACQDGKDAGQSIPHVHFHIMPRGGEGDRFAGPRNDDIYPHLEEHARSLPEAFEKLAQGGGSGGSAFQPLKMDAEEERRPRTMEDMEREAAWLKTFFERDD